MKSAAPQETPNNLIDIKYASYHENMKFPIHSFMSMEKSLSLGETKHTTLAL